MDCSTAKSGSLSMLQKHILNGSEDINEYEECLLVKLKSDSNTSSQFETHSRMFLSARSTKYGPCGIPFGSKPHLSTRPPYRASPAISEAGHSPGNISTLHSGQKNKTGCCLYSLCCPHKLLLLFVKLCCL